MANKRFIPIDDGLDFMVRDAITGDDLIDADGVADVLNDYEKENKQLKQALFFYLDIVLSESITDFDKWCNLLFNCNYEEAKRRYDDFEYKERWESE